MNTRTVDPRTVWAMLAMEAGLALPVISLLTQGDRVAGMAGPLLMLLLLPLGYVGVRLMPALRDPSWRLLGGIGLALLARAMVSDLPEADVRGLAVWLGRSIVPAAVGVALWWRGGALCVAEVTASDIRVEFSVVVLCMLGMLALLRPFVLHDQVFLGGAVALVVVGGLLATAMSRQDAAEAVSLPFGRTLAVLTVALPTAASLLLVSVLRPELLGAMWWTIGRLVELALTPIGLLLAWLASLFPRSLGLPEGLPPRPLTRLAPDPAALAALEEGPTWIATVAAILLIAVAGVVLLLVTRALLANWIGAPLARAERRGPALTVEQSGTPGRDAAALWAWLLNLVRGRFRRGSRGRGTRGAWAPDADGFDAWIAYRRLLAWAEEHSLGRRAAETTGQLETRLTQRLPDAAKPVGLLTRTYEHHRYGGRHPGPDHLRQLRQALSALLNR